MIEIRGVTAESTSTCAAGGSATGGTKIAGLYVGRRQVAVTAGPNSTIHVAGVARPVVNEQEPVAEADHGLAVNGVNLAAAGET